MTEQYDNIKVLIIEDNVITLAEIEIRMQSMGFSQIETATTGEEALEIVKNFKPDLILTDINLGKGIDGIETVELIRKQCHPIVIYLTAYHDTQTRQRANQNEPYAYLVKPLQERDLQISIDIAIYKHRTEKQLRELIATKDKFFNIIAHDLKAPFNSILGFTNLLIKNYKTYSPERVEKIIKSLNESAKNSFNLVENLLTWARTQNGKIEYQPIEMKLKNIVSSIIKTLEKSAEAKNIIIIDKVSENTSIFADENMLQTVVRNLVSNAIKFTDSGGKIEITSKTDNDFEIVSVSDTGVGIPPEVLKNLFSIESNESTFGTNGEAGTGLGLILCKEFVEKNGGKIWCKSTVGKGSTFYFSVPKV